jgi:hypothetical protein
VNIHPQSDRGNSNLKRISQISVSRAQSASDFATLTYSDLYFVGLPRPKCFGSMDLISRLDLFAETADLLDLFICFSLAVAVNARN